VGRDQSTPAGRRPCSHSSRGGCRDGGAADHHCQAAGAGACSPDPPAKRRLTDNALARAAVPADTPNAASRGTRAGLAVIASCMAAKWFAPGGNTLLLAAGGKWCAPESSVPPTSDELNAEHGSGGPRNRGAARSECR